MHYYQHNIADYRKDTGHLSLLEHGIYRQLLDTYYLDEKPIETQRVIRRLSIKTDSEKSALQNVLNDFFKLSECGVFYVKKRCDKEIAKYREKAEIAKANGCKGGRPKKPRKTQPVNSANPEETGSKPNSLTKELNNSTTINQSKEKTLTPKPAASGRESYSDLFNLIWPLFDRKTGKKKALENFKNLKPDKTLVGEMKAALTRERERRGKAKEAGAFIPIQQDPERWLKNERWNDELPEIKRQRNTHSGFADKDYDDIPEGFAKGFGAAT